MARSHSRASHAAPRKRPRVGAWRTAKTASERAFNDLITERRTGGLGNPFYGKTMDEVHQDGVEAFLGCVRVAMKDGHDHLYYHATNPELTVRSGEEDKTFERVTIVFESSQGKPLEQV